MAPQEQFAVADAREADHRFANHLALLSGFVRFKSADVARQRVGPTVEEVQLILENLRSQIDAMARLHRSLADGASGAPVDLAEQLHKICEPLSLVLGGRIALIEDVRPGCRLASDRVLPLTQIVAEVITNSVKHAYRLGQVGRIRVGGRGEPDGRMVVEIADDGPGLPQGFDAETDSGLGFHLIRALAVRMEAVVDYETRNDGLCFRLTLPAKSTG